MAKKIRKFENIFWSFFRTVGAFIAVPRIIAEQINKYFGFNEFGIMFGIAVIVWIFYRESIILDLKKGWKNGKK